MTQKPLVPHTPTIDIDYDKYGHCVKCHRYLMVEKIIDQKIQLVNTPEYDEEEYLLDNGSRMRVATCKKCKAEITTDDESDIMKCVIKGWKIESDYLPHWTDKQRKDYMDEYGKRKIVCKAKGKDNDHLEKALKEYKHGNS